MENKFFQLQLWWKNSPYFRGAFWKVSSFFCFSLINGVVRFLSQHSQSLNIEALPAYEVAFFQNLFGLVFLIPWILQNGPRSLKTQKPGLQACRVIISAIGVVLWYRSLTYTPLAQAVALMFLGPLITIIGAKFFLHEVIGRERAIAIIIGLIGGALISHSTFINTGFSWLDLSFYAGLPILAACAFSTSTLMIRKLTSYDSPQLIVIYLLVFMAPVLFIPTLINGVWPEMWQWPWLIVMGGLAASAHLFLSKAYATAEVSYLFPYGFTKWFASAAIGFAAFGEIPTFWTCVGAFIIMGAIMLLSFIEAKKRPLLASFQKLKGAV